MGFVTTTSAPESTTFAGMRMSALRCRLRRAQYRLTGRRLVKTIVRAERIDDGFATRSTFSSWRKVHPWWAVWRP